MKWLLNTGMPQMLQPLYDFYLYDQLPNLPLELIKMFINKPVIYLEYGTRKFYEDFGSLFPRVPKQVFMQEIANKQQLTYSGFVFLIFTLAQE